MMSIRSLADFNGAPLGGAVTGWHRHRHRPGPTLRVDTTKEGWGLLPGHQRGPTPGHQRGLSHGHGHQAVPSHARSEPKRRPRHTAPPTTPHGPAPTTPHLAALSSEPARHLPPTTPPPAA